MTGYYEIAKRIPDDIRSQMLHGNYIFKAVANEQDAHMIMLFIIYANYIEPYNPSYKYADGRIIDACPICLTQILDKFKMLESYLIEMEKQQNLIES